MQRYVFFNSLPVLFQILVDHSVFFAKVAQIKYPICCQFFQKELDGGDVGQCGGLLASCPTRPVSKCFPERKKTAIRNTETLKNGMGNKNEN